MNSGPHDYFAPAGRPECAAAVQRVSALRTACASWHGTPFRLRSLVKGPGGGVDCAGFVGAVFAEIGAIPAAVAVPPYALNHAEHSTASILRSWFEQPAVRHRVRRVDEDEPHLDGDIVFPVVGRTEHHLGLRVGGLVHHILRPAGYCAMTLAQLNFAPSRYRLMEEPVRSQPSA
ncbi:MAG: hypothetical protein NTV51_16895 [Verrucomicrobia bacterium]|nr:hypothetical protein [Verrucomicrobiota bacterium]